jgi:hypothetical protein
MIKLTLCKNACCPTINLLDGQVIIKDDFGGTVTLTLDQLKILVDKYPEIAGGI